MVDCTILHNLDWLWNCYDVPNWLTLVVEIAVAGFLAVVFYRLSNKWTKKQEQLQNYQKWAGEMALSFLLMEIMRLTNVMEENYEDAITNGSNEVSQQEFDKWLNYQKEQQSKLKDILLIYAHNFDGSTSYFINDLANNLTKFTTIVGLENDILINDIRKLFVEIKNNFEFPVSASINGYVEHVKTKIEEFETKRKNVNQKKL